ncbi:hypothetical protein SEEB0197_01572 [Salmonella enterica subsp. enterica serovar Bareilly str. CFSAN000197]|nr:hypothetical protein SEEB0197_01572 [Salmonella enterica subsp. enterica serovar Bareilly str. CFSAN000197]
MLNWNERTKPEIQKKWRRSRKIWTAPAKNFKMHKVCCTDSSFIPDSFKIRVVRFTLTADK